MYLILMNGQIIWQWSHVQTLKYAEVTVCMEIFTVCIFRGQAIDQDICEYNFTDNLEC